MVLNLLTFLAANKFSPSSKRIFWQLAKNKREGITEASESFYKSAKDVYRRWAEQQIVAAEKKDLVLVSPLDEIYPRRLLHLEDAPLVIYLKLNDLDKCGWLGDLGFDLVVNDCVSVVGARDSTSYGEKVSSLIAKEVILAGSVIVSGLAKGIDASAHRGALECYDSASANTKIKQIAVIGTGFNYCYPKTHGPLVEQIVDCGGIIISEYPLERTGYPIQFPERNRIIAALGSSLVVVEAKEKSGSLITAKIASELGREVYAVCGSIFSELSLGTHGLIKNGARPLIKINEVLPVGVKSSFLAQSVSSCGVQNEIITDRNCVASLDFKLERACEVIFPLVSEEDKIEISKILKLVFSKKSVEIEFLLSNVSCSVEKLKALLQLLELEALVSLTLDDRVFWGDKIKL